MHAKALLFRRGLTFHRVAFRVRLLQEWLIPIRILPERKKLLLFSEAFGGLGFSRKGTSETEMREGIVMR